MRKIQVLWIDLHQSKVKGKGVARKEVHLVTCLCYFLVCILYFTNDGLFSCMTHNLNYLLPVFEKYSLPFSIWHLYSYPQSLASSTVFSVKASLRPLPPCQAELGPPLHCAVLGPSAHLYHSIQTYCIVLALSQQVT